MTREILVAIIAFFALGATLLGMIFQLFVDPRSRPLRWFLLFEADIALWLGLQGWIFARGEIGGLGPFYEASVHMLPGLFLAATLVDVRGWSDLRAVVVVAVSAALLPISVGGLIGDTPRGGLAILVWQILGWTAGSLLHFGDRRHRGASVDPAVRRRLGRAVAVTLMLIGPLAVVVGWLAGGDFFAFVMPLLVVGIEILIMFGIVHLRFYDIEVRAVRSGETAARAAEMERLAVVGEMAASFAHEVRNPLTGVRSLAQRLAEEDLPDDKRRSYADLIVREVGRVEGIVARTLGLARRAPETGGGPTPLAPLFGDLTLLVAGRAERGGVELQLESDGLSCAAAREPLAQALLNLLLNAVAHSPRGGAVELLARRPEDGHGGATAPGGSDDPGAVEIVVRDQGPGIPASERARVFEPLYSGTGGTGLGLAVVRRIAEELGWSVTIRDAPGGGAEFRLGIPGGKGAGGPA